MAARLASTITAPVLRRYLELVGWQVEDHNDRRTVWRSDRGHYAWVPTEELADFDEVRRVALQEIAADEQRQAIDVIEDLAWLTFDKLAISRPADSSGIDLAAALEIHKAVRDAILFGARSPERRHSYPGGGRYPKPIDDYLDRVRVLPAESGSYVVRALLPLGAAPIPGQLTFIDPNRGWRAMSQAVMDSVRAAVDAAREVVAVNSPVPWRRAAEDNGVSANLLTALASIAGDLDFDRDDAESVSTLRAEWSPLEPFRRRDNRRESVEIPVTLAPTLDAGSAFLARRPVTERISVLGRIVKLHREGVGGPGDITIRGRAGAGPLRVFKFNVDESTYHDAVNAHDNGHSVGVSALMERRPRQLQQQGPAEFRVLPDTGVTPFDEEAQGDRLSTTSADDDARAGE